jgi:diacylglycerol O-acyltransferase
VRTAELTLGELANVWVDEPAVPFHIALAGEFDAFPFLRRDGSLDVERVRVELARRVGRVPALRRRVVWPRRRQGRPYWAEDPAFDAGGHITGTDLPARVSFVEWCAEAILRPLDRSRPLWRAEVVGGLPGNRFGVLIVVHHAVAGGLAGVALAAALLDTGPEDSPESPRPAPAATELSTPAPTGAPPSRSGPDRRRHRWRQLADAAADFRIRAPVTSLSRPVGPGRRLATVGIPLAELHQAAHRLGVTVNDLLLSAITGGLRELLVGRGDDVTGLVLRASVPVGTRTAGQPDGMLLVGLPVGEARPLHRLATIHESTARLKSRLRSGGGDVLDVLQLPLPAARLAVRWMRRIAGGRINLFVTNVPGPEQPLWLAGARLLAAVPVAPLGRGVPLGIAALSYAGTLQIGINADAAIADLDVLAAGVQRSFTALTDAARDGAPVPAVPPGAADPAARRGVENTVEIDRNPAAVFAFMIDPRHELDWNRQLLAVEQLTDGPIGVGTRLRMRFGHGVGDSTVTYVAYDPPRSWAGTSTSRRLDVRLDGAVQPAGNGTRLVIGTRLLPRGPLRPLAPVLRRCMHRTWDRNLAIIKAQLENHERGHPEMRVAIVYESLYGNTHEIAAAVAAGVTEAQPDAHVDLLRVGEADPARAAEADLLIVGGPTHMRGMTTGLSRKLGVSAEDKKEPGERHDLEPDAEGPGVRDWLHDLPKAAGRRPAAAFDTRIGAKLAGGAAHSIARRLEHHGYEVIVEPEGFYIQDNGEGPLKEGETERAHAWAAGLLRQVAAAVPSATR